ncbi:LOW QUALITY PROTEIN: melanoma-associated antigen 4 [Callospermophilus lateralis]
MVPLPVARDAGSKSRWRSEGTGTGRCGCQSESWRRLKMPSSLTPAPRPFVASHFPWGRIPECPVHLHGGTPGYSFRLQGMLGVKAVGRVREQGQGAVGVKGGGHFFTECPSGQHMGGIQVLPGEGKGPENLILPLKYQMTEPVTNAEMLNNVIRDDQEHFPIFSKASECMQLVFGIDIEVDPSNHSYVLVIALGLIYDEMLNDEQSMPKTGLLVNILIVIFLDGSCTPEKVVWEVLSVMGMHAGREHFIYGEPGKLISEDLVEEQYLEYRQVPSSDPVWYEFPWGPRAHAETSKVKVL